MIDDRTYFIANLVHLHFWSTSHPTWENNNFGVYLHRAVCNIMQILAFVLRKSQEHQTWWCGGVGGGKRGVPEEEVFDIILCIIHCAALAYLNKNPTFDLSPDTSQTHTLQIGSCKPIPISSSSKNSIHIGLWLFEGGAAIFRCWVILPAAWLLKPQMLKQELWYFNRRLNNFMGPHCLL